MCRGAYAQYIDINITSKQIMCSMAHAQYNEGPNSTHYICPLLEQHCPDVLGTRNELMKQVGVSLFHGVFILPCDLLGPKVLLLHF